MHITHIRIRLRCMYPNEFIRYKYGPFTIMSIRIIRHVVIVLMYKFGYLVFFIDLLQQSIILFVQIFNSLKMPNESLLIFVPAKAAHKETEVFQFLFVILIDIVFEDGFYRFSCSKSHSNAVRYFRQCLQNRMANCVNCELAHRIENRIN